MPEYKLDSKDEALLAVIEEKPFRKYTQHDLTPRRRSYTLDEAMEMASDISKRLRRLSKLGLIREETKTFYFSTKAQIGDFS